MPHEGTVERFNEASARLDATAIAKDLCARARQALDADRLPAAAALYAECLAADPRNAEAHHDLGVMAERHGRDREAIAYFQTAVSIEPGHAHALENLCIVLTRVGRAADAVEAGQAAVRCRPDSATARIGLGAAFECLGDREAALRCFERAADLDPQSAAVWLKLANLLRLLDRPGAALDCAERSVALDPAHHGARVLRAIIRDGLGETQGAGEDFAAAARLCPPSAAALNFLGVICVGHGRFEIAVEILRHAVRVDPTHAEAQGNLGLALQRLGRLREAFEAYVEAVTIEPTHVVAQCNLAGVLIEIDQLDAAISACRLAARQDPACVQAHVYQAIALRRQGRSAAAITVLRQGLHHAPQAGEALIELCDLRQQSCDWVGLKEEQRAAMALTYRAGKRVPPFQVLAMTGSAEEHRMAARVWAAGFAHKTARLAPYAPRPPSERHRRLRLGYLSADFRTHATSLLIAELLERHDREAFEVHGYSCGEDDGGATRRRLAQAMDRFVDIRAMSHDAAAHRIFADGIDILVDLKGYTSGARPEILVRRPAPIQVNFLGYPGTLGADFIDYIVADRVVAPPDQAGHFDEKIVTLPHSYQPNDGLRAMDPIPTRAACGLPERGFVFCCLNASYKITPDMFDVWMRLLRDTPTSILWLYAGDGSAVENLRREAAARHIDPGRLVFAPKLRPEAHLARLALADLFLDTLPVNAHTTASEALWAGLPVLTCAGDAFVSRVAGSLLHAIGLGELVTTSLPDYEALARTLARDPGRLAGIRATLASNRMTTPLFDTSRYARNFEAALTRMAALRDLGRPPEAFTVEDTAG